MLILARKQREVIHIGRSVEVTILFIGDPVVLGVTFNDCYREFPMLPGDMITIDDPTDLVMIKIKLLSRNRKYARLGITAPIEVPIDRERLEQMQERKRKKLENA